MYSTLSITDSEGPRSRRLDELDFPLRVGTRRSCGIVIVDETASREHLRMSRVGDTYYVENVSRFGTRLERGRQSERLEGTRALYAGDILFLGDNTRIVYQEVRSFNEPGVAAEPSTSTPSGASADALGDIDLSAVTEAEGRVLQVIYQELEKGSPLPKNVAIASVLSVSENTVKTHLAHIYQKTSVAPPGAAAEPATVAGTRARLVDIARAWAARQRSL